jgi:hypothetical protein
MNLQPVRRPEFVRRIGHELPLRVQRVHTGERSGSGNRCTGFNFIALQRVRMHIDEYFAKSGRALCQNCVRYPLKLGSNTVVYGSIPMHIVVAGSR